MLVKQGFAGAQNRCIVIRGDPEILRLQLLTDNVLRMAGGVPESDSSIPKSRFSGMQERV